MLKMATRSMMFDGHLFAKPSTIITTITTTTTTIGQIGFLFLLVATINSIIHCSVIESNHTNTSAKIIISGSNHQHHHHYDDYDHNQTKPIVINAFGPIITSFLLDNPIDDQDWPNVNVTKMVNGKDTLMIIKPQQQQQQQKQRKIRRHSSLSSSLPKTKQLISSSSSKSSSSSIVGVGQDGQSSLLMKNSKTTIIDRCSPKTFETCLSMMQDVMENSSLAFPTDDVHLDITCRKLKSGDYCAEKYIRSCADNRQRNLYQDIVQGSKNVIRLLCRQGETQQLYLKYATCLKDISTSPYKCLDVVLRFQTISRQMSTTHSTETEQQQQAKNDDGLQRFCCSYQESVDCQLLNVRKYCGQDGLKFFEHYMTEMTSSLINEHCIGYTFSDKCRSYIQLQRQHQQQQQRKPLIHRLHHSNRNNHSNNHRGINEFVYFNNSTQFNQDDDQNYWNHNHHHQNDFINDLNDYEYGKNDRNSHDSGLDLDSFQHLLILLLVVTIQLTIIPWFY